MDLAYDLTCKDSPMHSIIIETVIELPQTPEEKANACFSEKQALLESFDDCRKVLGIKREEADGEKGENGEKGQIPSHW